MVKRVCLELGFGNPFDVTKIDNKNKLPRTLLEEDFAIIHLGSGKHKFIKGVDMVYHNFEPIQKSMNWEYKKSILNLFNSSESNVLSVANNQRILHHFLFGKDMEFDNVDILKRPKTYFPHRTKTSFSYSLGTDILDLVNIQIEVDLTIEFNRVIGVFEAKNGSPDNFSIYQIYHPFLYYHNANKKGLLNGDIRETYGVYVVREKIQKQDVLKLWAYTFSEPTDITSIKFVKSAEYKLIKTN